MGLFSNTPKRVTIKEYRTKLRSALKKRGLHNSDLHQIDLIFQGHMGEKGDRAGIDSREIDSAIKWLKKHKGKHHIESEDIKTVEEEMRKLL